MIIYAITNTVNGKRYIGMTAGSLSRRWSGHKYGAWHGKGKCAKMPIVRAMRRYGIENFRIEQIASVIPGNDRRAMIEAERAIIAQEKTMLPRGYNATPGGDGVPKGTPSPMKGKKATDEHRANLRAAWARNPDRKVKQRAAQLGKPMSAEHRKRWKESQTEARRAAKAELLRERNAVMNQSPEHKAKLKAAWAKNAARRERASELATRVLGEHSRTPEHKARVSAMLRTLVQDPEWKAAQSVRMKEWWAQRREHHG